MQDALARFEQQRSAAVEQLDGLVEALRAGPAPPALAERLKALARRAETGRLRVVLLGAFSTGKTTLLDALVGRQLLPTRVNPCTAVLTEVVWGEQVEVTLHEHLREATTELALDAFTSWYRLDDDANAPLAADRFGHIERAEVRVPAELLRHGVALVDTPGLDDDPVRTQRTLHALRDADAVLFISSATRFLGHLEKTLLTEHIAPLGLTNLFFVGTMSDLLSALSDDPEAARQGLLSRARAIAGPLTVVDGVDRFSERFFLVDARGALSDAKRGAPPSADTGVPQLTASLARFLGEERGAAWMRHLAGSVTATELELVRRRQLDLAGLEHTTEELRTRVDELEPLLVQLDQSVQRVDALTARFVDTWKDRIEGDLRAFLDETAAGVPAALAAADLGTAPALRVVAPAGREDVVERLEDALAGWLGEREIAWRQRLEARLADALAELRADLGPEAERFDALDAEIRDGFANTSLPRGEGVGEGPVPDALERWISVALGALMLSPGTVAAAWTDGFGAVAQGVAGRAAARLAVTILGAISGPAGWAGLVMYAVADAVVVAVSGERHLDRLRARLATVTRERLDAQRTETAPRLRLELGQLLEPLRARIVEAVRQDAGRTRTELAEVIDAHRVSQGDVRATEASWQQAIEATHRTAAALAELGG